MSTGERKSAPGSLEENRIGGFRVWSIEIDAVKLPDSLSAAEGEVAELVLAGKTNQEVAELRATSVRTVANQLASIYKKLGVNSRSELASRLAE